MIPSPSDISKMKEIASLLGVPYEWMFKLIKRESNFNPLAMNPKSTAKGLIQFIDKTAQGLGYATSKLLIEKLPTFNMQMDNAVLPYFRKYAPFANKKEFYMTVFYPAWRKKPGYTVFPPDVQELNKGIRTINDYVRFIDTGMLMNAKTIFPFALLTILGIGVLLWNKQK